MTSVRDITDAEFEECVVERSREIPVVIDLWAPWCGPCRQLTPVLEQVAEARAGEFELVKLNVDENPQVAQMLGARSIPLVVAFRDGKPAGQFVGAQPVGAINEFIDQLQPSESDLRVAAANQALLAGDSERAEGLLRENLAVDAHHESSRLALARLLEDAGRAEEALEVLGAIATGTHDAAGQLMAEIRTRMAAGIDTDALQRRLDAEPGDIGVRIELGKALAAKGRHEEGLDQLLDALGRDRTFGDDAARRAMIDIFEMLGAESPVTREYRKRLSRALF